MSTDQTEWRGGARPCVVCEELTINFAPGAPNQPLCSVRCERVIIDRLKSEKSCNICSGRATPLEEHAYE